MKVSDRIYGEVEVTEPVLLDLMNSLAITRLKGISQFGIPRRFYHFDDFSRYEHSVGVMLLLQRLGASVEEQAAGLIHDVSHTAFSHLVDWVMGDRTKEDHQDRNLLRIIFSSDIPRILESHGFDAKRVSDLGSYGLLERPPPNLCADRVDYALREFAVWANPKIVRGCIDGLVNHEGEIAFSTVDSARDFAYTYAKCQREHWGGAECVVRYELFARALRIGLKLGYITKKDFDLQDEEVVSKLISPENIQIFQILSTLENPHLKLVTNHVNPQFNTEKKFRCIDPKYLHSGKLVSLSESDEDFKIFLDEQRRLNELGIKVDLVV